MYDDLIGQLLSLPGRDPRMRSCRLTGSCATGEADQYSDIDLVVEVEQSERDAVIQRLPEFIAEIEPVEIWYMIAAGETLGAGNWRIPYDTFFFLLRGGAMLELMLDTGVIPIDIPRGYCRPVLLALWSTNFPRWAKAFCRHQQAAIDMERECIQDQLAHISLGFPEGNITEAMDYLESCGPKLCKAAAE